MTPDKLNVYDVLLVSLHKSCRRHTTRWVRNIRAESLTKACDFAVARHPDVDMPEGAEIFCIPVRDKWGLK